MTADRPSSSPDLPGETDAPASAVTPADAEPAGGDDSPGSPSAGGRRRAGRMFRVLVHATTIGLTGLAVIALTAGGIALLHARSGSEPGAVANPPIAVDAVPLALTDTLVTNSSYAGRLEPARETALAFERAGLVLTVLVDEGDTVKEGEIVARLDTDKLRARRDELLAQRRELEARLDLAKATLSRQAELNDRGWSPQQRLDEASFGAAELEAAIERLEAGIRSIDIDIEKSDLKAPFTGTIAARSVDEGAVVASGAPVVTLLETGRSLVRIGVAVDAQHALTPGTEYPLTANGVELAGRLIAVRPDLETGTRTATALFEIDGPTALPFGEIVELTLEQSVPMTGAWVPVEALTEGEKGLWTVFVVRPGDDGDVVRRDAVEVLHVSGDRAYVGGAFADGTMVVTDGVNRLAAGQRVAVAGD